MNRLALTFYMYMALKLFNAVKGSTNKIEENEGEKHNITLLFLTLFMSALLDVNLSYWICLMADQSL